MLLTNKKKKVESIILAGVYRWDAASFESVIPRPLLPVVNTPLICYPLNWLRYAGITNATICANSESRLVRICLCDGSALGMKLDYYEDLIPRGPAGCVRDAGDHSDAELFVVSNGTSIPQIDLKRLLDTHISSGAAATVVLTRDLENGNMVEDRLIPTDIYVFGRHVLNYIPETGYQDIKEVLIPHLYDRGELVAAYVSKDPCLHVRDAGSYLVANKWILQQITHQPSSLSEYRQADQSCVHCSARLARGTNLIGPVVNGEIGIQRRLGCELSQQTHAQAMERAYSRRTADAQFTNSLPHLPGSLVGKRDRQNV